MSARAEAIAQLRRDHAFFGPTRTFVVARPEKWQAAVYWEVNPFEDFGSHMIDILVERGFAPEAPPDEAQKDEIREEANRRMARQFQMLFWSE